MAARLSLSTRIIAFVLVPIGTVAQVETNQTPPRMPRPNWTQIDTREIYFEHTLLDAFQGMSPFSTPRTQARGTPDALGERGPRRTRWSHALDGDLLEDEIKRITIAVQRGTQQRSSFMPEVKRSVANDVATASVLLRILSEWEGAVRFHDQAHAASSLLVDVRQRLARPGDEAYEAASRASIILSDLVRGNRVSVDRPPIPGWSDYVDRRRLMNRLEQALDSVLEPAANSSPGLAMTGPEFAREANVVAAILGALYQDGVVDANEAEYVALCKAAARNALDLRNAASAKDVARVETALRRLTHSCDRCHDAYR